MATRTSTRRSTTSTAERPESATRACSQALCRQVAEHHWGSVPPSRRDRPVAPSTGRGGRPSFRADYSGGLRFEAGFPGQGSLELLTPSPLQVSLELSTAGLRRHGRTVVSSSATKTALPDVG
jgi:hypothetical protein